MDLSLDLNRSSPNFRDLLLAGGDLHLTGDADPLGAPPVLQSILQRLRTFRGEWFLNKNLGVPYFQQILTKNPNRAAIDGLLQGTILSTPGVLRLTEYTSNFDTVGRVITVTFRCVTTSGVVTYAGPLNFAGAMVVQ